MLYDCLYRKRCKRVSVSVYKFYAACAFSALLLWRECNHHFGFLSGLYINVLIESPDTFAARDVSVDLDSFLGSVGEGKCMTYSSFSRFDGTKVPFIRIECDGTFLCLGVYCCSKAEYADQCCGQSSHFVYIFYLTILIS